MIHHAKENPFLSFLVRFCIALSLDKKRKFLVSMNLLIQDMKILFAKYRKIVLNLQLFLIQLNSEGLAKI